MPKVVLQGWLQIMQYEIMAEHEFCVNSEVHIAITLHTDAKDILAAVSNCKATQQRRRATVLQTEKYCAYGFANQMLSQCALAPTLQSCDAY